MKATINLHRIFSVTTVAGGFERISALVTASHRDGDYLERTAIIAPAGMFAPGAAIVNESITVDIRLRTSQQWGPSLSIFALSRLRKSDAA